jgi:hypothetical protein
MLEVSLGHSRNGQNREHQVVDKSSNNVEEPDHGRKQVARSRVAPGVTHQAIGLPRSSGIHNLNFKTNNLNWELRAPVQRELHHGGSTHVLDEVFTSQHQGRKGPQTECGDQDGR